MHLYTLNREIVLDTETTGLNPQDGHRIVEIGCIELIDALPSGRSFHVYINPERDMPIEAERVHGLSAQFLAQHNTFDCVLEGFLEFIAKDPLIIHNAPFDMRFLNAELLRYGRPILENPVVDTLALAAKKFPGSPKSLDALCKRFNVSLEKRDMHGALLDAQLLAQVYLEGFKGGRNPTFFENLIDSQDTIKGPSVAAALSTLSQNFTEDLTSSQTPFEDIARRGTKTRLFTLSQDEQYAHQELLKKLMA